MENIMKVQQNTKFCLTASQGGHQPVIVTGLSAVLNEGEIFRTSKLHKEHPDRLLVIPKGCVGVVDKTMTVGEEGIMSILYKDTITARRLIQLVEGKHFTVSANEDKVKKLSDKSITELSWEPTHLVNGNRWPNKIQIGFSAKADAQRLYSQLVEFNCSPAKNWI